MLTITPKEVLRRITGKDTWEVTGVFGEKKKPRKYAHDGTDYALPEGVALRAPENCIVVGEQKGVHQSSSTTSFGFDFGNWVLLYVEEWNRTYLFAHTMYKQSLVNVGQPLKKEQLVTLSGNTGLSTGPHLHLGVAIGKFNTLTAFRQAAINFETDLITIGGEVKPTTRKITFEAGTTLYNAEKKPYPLKTSVKHTVDGVEVSPNFYRFSAPWLEGVSEAFVKMDEGVPAKPQSMVGKTVTIPGNTTLRRPDGSAYPVPTSNSHQVKIIAEKGDLLQFKAGWLQGVDNAWVKKGSVK